MSIDDRLMDEARRVGGHKTKKEAVTAALREYVNRRKQVKIIELAGTIDYDEGHDYKALRRKKPR